MHVLILILFLGYVLAERVPVQVHKKESITEITMSAEAGLEMYQKWMDQAFSGLFSAIASKHLSSLSDGSQVELEECSKKATSVIRHAGCLKEMFGALGTRKKPKKVSRITKYSKENPNTTYGKWVGGFRVKRQVKQARVKRQVEQASNYNLLGRYSGLTFIGSVAYTLNRALGSNKNKTIPTSWQQIVENVRRSALERKKAKEDLSKRINEDWRLSNMERLAFKTLEKNDRSNQLEETIENPDELIEVANKKEPNKPIGRLVNLIKDGVKLGYRLAQKNITEKELDDKTFKLISPRFLSVVPDNDTDSMNFISPSLLSLHDEGTGLENLTSLPTLMQEFTGRDQQEWLNFIVEAAGIDDQAKKLDAETVEIRRIKHIENYEKEVRNPETGQPLYFTKQNVTDMYGNHEKQKIEIFERLIASYTPEQMRELNLTG